MTLPEGTKVTSLCARCGAVHDWTVYREYAEGHCVPLVCDTGKQVCGLNSQFVLVDGRYAPKVKGVEA